MEEGPAKELFANPKSARSRRRRRRRPISGCLLVLSLIVALSASAHAQGLKAERPIVGEDGSPVANHTIAPGSVAAAEKLPGAVVAANPDGDVTLVEFYDLNCPIAVARRRMSMRF
jgi:protein-disulfide isomerase